ncbi:MAG: integration host factor subunit beta [Prevotellaceae bacterium]|nr:integration host factor subunit beta [Candidatus Minthosoma caballi]
MTKAEIVSAICKETGVEKDKALKVVEAFMSIVKDQTAAGEDIFLRGFGTFTTKTRAQKIGRLIKEEKSVIVPEHKIPYFKPCEEYKELLANK